MAATARRGSRAVVTQGGSVAGGDSQSASGHANEGSAYKIQKRTLGPSEFTSKSIVPVHESSHAK
jgi:hypothetical protein